MSDPECTSIDKLIADVESLLGSGQTGAVSEYLQTARLEPECLTPYLHLNQSHYTRNLIFKNELFELLALCWDVGQHSWIHNHQGQHCWMKVTEGTLAVSNYKRVSCDQQLRTVQLAPLPKSLISQGSAAKVDPTEPVHMVWNPADFNQPAVSLHVYSLPFDTCVAYDQNAGLCRDVMLDYTSEGGVLTNRQRAMNPLADLPVCACALNPDEQDAHCGVIPGTTVVESRPGS